MHLDISSVVRVVVDIHSTSSGSNESNLKVIVVASLRVSDKERSCDETN
jgi:hypothetical protein